MVSSFTKPKCQTPFTGLITCKVGNDWMFFCQLILFVSQVTPALPSPTPGPVSYNSFNNITLSLPSSRCSSAQHAVSYFLEKNLPQSWCRQPGYPSSDVCQSRAGINRCHAYVSKSDNLYFQVEGGALKQNTFGKLPECLCFHVQVFCTLCIFLKMIMNI